MLARFTLGAVCPRAGWFLPPSFFICTRRGLPRKVVRGGSGSELCKGNEGPERETGTRWWRAVHSETSLKGPDDK